MSNFNIKIDITFIVSLFAHSRRAEMFQMCLNEEPGSRDAEVSERNAK